MEIRGGLAPTADGRARWLRALTITLGPPLVMALACTAPPRTKPQPLNVLLVTIDTFRADRIGVGVAPAIDRLAAAGTWFTAARTAVPLTLPSHTTIHTGLLPPAHGVRENGVDAPAPAPATIATVMKAAGYDTAAFIGAFVLDHRFGLARGFDTYDDQIPRDPDATERLEAERPASAVVDRALAWLNDEPRTTNHEPFFLWLHLYDPHAPYQPPQEFLARSRTPYDGEVAYADAQFARVLDALRARKLLDRTVVVVAGDHGEGLGEHGERTHGMLLYDSTLRVPLIITVPGRAAARVDEAVSLADVAPTLLHTIGIQPPDAMKGRDLLERVQPKPDSTGTIVDRDLYSETEYPHVAGWSPLQALTDGRWMTIRAGPVTEVYDLRADPGESHDLSASQATLGGAMSARAAAIHASAASGTRAISAEAQERLRTLGYVSSSVPAAPADSAPNPASRIAAWNDFEEALSALSSRRPDALPMLQRLAAANPDAPVIQTTMARAMKEAGQVDAALASYRAAAKRWPADAVLLHDLAVAARQAAARRSGAAAAALHDEARRADQAALTLQPDSAPALNGIGLLAIDDGRADRAIEAFERATALDSNNAAYWANLGNARRAGGDRAAAETAYRRALDVDPRAADAANGLGVLLVEAGHPADATPWFERALAAAPDLVEARLNLGISLQQSGQHARASEVYRQVLAAPARFTRERTAAAKLLAALGDRR